MSKNKRRPIVRFCKTCQKRIIFNKTKEDKLVCSRCGISFDSEQILPEVMKIQDPSKKANI